MVVYGSCFNGCKDVKCGAEADDEFHLFLACDIYSVWYRAAVLQYMYL